LTRPGHGDTQPILSVAADGQSGGVTALFPMAGQGARFGYTFKPFLTVQSETFIEAAVRPFRSRRDQIRELVFVCLRAQDTEFRVTERMASMFADLPHQVVLLDQPTRGPVETIARGVERARISGPVTICDCDHSLDVAPLFDLLASSEPFDCAVPVWPLQQEEVHAWAVARVDPKGRIAAIAEKAVPPGEGAAAGVIGCYVFRRIEDALAVAETTGAANFSEIMARWLTAGRIVRAVPIAQADFFGDPARLNATLERRHRESTTSSR
jgi:hypothetical protein